MYLTNEGTTYYRGTEQCHSRAPFLILFSGSEKYTASGKPVLYAAVRKVALRQCGHWMMGSARIAGTRIPISGSCGADGLPCEYDSLSPAVRSKLMPVPEDTAIVYWSDDGHNTIGKAAPTVRAWAIEHFGIR